MRVRVLASVVLCALLIALAIVANIDPYLPMRLLGMGYTLSVLCRDYFLFERGDLRSNADGQGPIGGAASAGLG
jgi:hypothetical protein